MQMFRHQDKCHQPVGPVFEGSINRLAKQLSPDVIRDERHSPITGKRQFMQIAGFMVMSNPFSMSSHVFDPHVESCHTRCLESDFIQPMSIAQATRKTDKTTDDAGSWQAHWHWRAKPRQWHPKTSPLTSTPRPDCQCHPARNLALLPAVTMHSSHHPLFAQSANGFPISQWCPKGSTNLPTRQP